MSLLSSAHGLNLELLSICFPASVAFVRPCERCSSASHQWPPSANSRAWIASLRALKGLLGFPFLVPGVEELRARFRDAWRSRGFERGGLNLGILTLNPINPKQYTCRSLKARTTARNGTRSSEMLPGGLHKAVAEGAEGATGAEGELLVKERPLKGPLGLYRGCMRLHKGYIGY